MATIQSIELITIDPRVRAGQPCIEGTGIRVTDIAIASLFHRRTPDEISTDYGISLAQVHAALAYYYEHRNTLDTHIRQQINVARELKDKRVGGGSSLLSG